MPKPWGALGFFSLLAFAGGDSHLQGRVLLLDAVLAHGPCEFRKQLKWDREQTPEFLHGSPMFPASYFVFLRVHRLCMA